VATRVLLYEFVTGGGWWSVDARLPPNGSLLAEGRAMIAAVAEDFARLPGIEVWTSLDSRLVEFHPCACRVDTIGNAAAELDWLARNSSIADWTLLIAPESDGALARRCRLVEAAGGRLLSPSQEVVELAGDKQRTAERLARCGVPVPRGDLLANVANDVRFPAVVKPVDGCGSQGVRLLRSAADLAALSAVASGSGLNEARIEEFVPGLAASVAVQCGTGGHFPLPACEQRLSADGAFTYLGGRLPLPPALAQRATRLALTAVRALPPAVGYLGVDLILGEHVDGSSDSVIEINPRLTTSYVGLRALAEVNLAGAMLAVASGNAPDLRFGGGPVEFTADGVVRS
jgi:predicted ATP-grasp superfamily ATP-dependent carboligase